MRFALLYIWDGSGGEIVGVWIRKRQEVIERDGFGGRILLQNFRILGLLMG